MNVIQYIRIKLPYTLSIFQFKAKLSEKLIYLYARWIRHDKMLIWIKTGSLVYFASVVEI